MIHHPPFQYATPYHKRLVGIERFQQVLREKGADLVLHGHTHLATRQEIGGPDGPIPVICVPAAGNGTGNLKPAGRYNLFDIDQSKTGWRIRWTAHGQPASGSEFRQLVEEVL